jgi:hypothetical protein
MIAQGILPFKLERTEKEITPRSGLVLYAEVFKAFQIRDRIERHFPRPGSNRGYEAWQYIEPLLMMLVGGGRHIEDLREIQEDQALRRLIGMEEMPSLSTFGDWLMRLGAGGGVEGMAAVNEEAGVKIIHKSEVKEYTLDVDATVIEAEKKEAAWTYKKVKGYQPILGFLKETSVCLAYEFREGNVLAGAGATDFLEKCLALCPGIKRLRSDSAFYQANVVNWCEKREIKYTITADHDKGVKAAIQTVGDWKRIQTPEGEETDREVGSAIHIMNKTDVPFRLIVQRWRNPQLDLFEPEEWCYQVIATNMDELEPEEVIWFYNERGQVENLIKEVKIGFGMEQMVSGDFGANALYFAIGLLAYNTTQAQKLFFMDEEWKTRTIGSIRWQLIETAGRVVRHGRQLILKIVASWEKLQIFLKIRRACLGFG